MCCGDCSPIRCPAVPDTDWSAFTWRWQNPGAEAFAYTGGPIGSPADFLRQITPNDRPMFHPGVCKCLWMVALEDLHIELPLPVTTTYYAPCFGVLQRLGQSWQLTISRWFWGLGSDFWNNYAYRDWNFQEFGNADCSQFRGGYAGWTPFGWNGFGWAYGWNHWGIWNGSYTTVCSYSLTGKLQTDGSPNLFTLSSFETTLEEDSPANWNDRRYWPATVTLSRIPKTGVL